MITISPPMAASQASEYYSSGSGNELLESFAADEIKRSNFQIAKSAWSGAIAEKFSLSGEVGQPDFEKVLDGINPVDGQQLVRHRRTPRPEPNAKTKIESAKNEINDSAGNVKDGKAKSNEIIEPVINKAVNIKSEKQNKKGKTAEHRACWDITFSAPKSVSLAAIVGGDLRLIEVHRQAVATALHEVEKFAEARLGGNKPPEQTGKLLFASFEHYIARPDKKNNFAAADLHTHNPVMNFTFAESGKSYALQPQKLFAVQKLGTAVYRLELAKRMNELGYEIHLDEKTKAPEIVSISREYIEAVSPRQTEIKAKAKELKISSTRRIVVRHRSAKTAKSADNIEFHRQIEKSFDFQAGAAVKESVINTKIFQPEIIEQLQAEVILRRTEIIEKAEKRQHYYETKQSENKSNEQTGTERKTRTIEEKLININAENGNGSNRTEESPIAVIPISRNTSTESERSVGSSDTEHRSEIEFRTDSKLRNEIADRNGSRQTFGGTKRELFAKIERSNGANQEFGSEDNGNELEDSRSFGRDENSGSENRIEFKNDLGKAGELTKSDSSESIARSRTDEIQAVDRAVAAEEITSASQIIGEPKPVAQSTAGKQLQLDGTDSGNDLRAGQDYPPFAISIELQTGDVRAGNSDGNSDGIARSELSVYFGRELSQIIVNEEVGIKSSEMVSDDSVHNVQFAGNLVSDFSDSDLLASDRRSDSDDFRNGSDLLDLHHSDALPRSGSGVSSSNNRNDNNLWGDLLPVDSESGFGQLSVQSGGFEFLDAGIAVNELSQTRSAPQFTASESADSGFSQSFAEITQIFETQTRQETLAADIIRIANELRLQNQQAEINRAVQEKMFAYLMQLSEGNPQNTDSTNNIGNQTSLETAYQNLMTDTSNLERFTQAVEDRHNSEEQEKRKSSENSKEDNRSPERFISEEELEYYDDQPEYEQESIMSMSL